jgi:hypothetical protein
MILLALLTIAAAVVCGITLIRERGVDPRYDDGREDYRS